ncbi:site-specific integrase [Pseudomonas qingdaonensis]|uniref:site-specific integrase n=1 Tax=Pseudomonas qingdaonensis TaxID=2056231 RepID=UPI0018CB5291|nr:site-specific integrase [Pseudomonas qingdaonensis]MBG8558317.1 site-specific integrase [Pseudomonas qingdaonensis]
MARIESVEFVPHRSVIDEGRVHWEALSGGIINALPQIFWADAQPWREANLWLMERASSRKIDLKTVQMKAACIHAYANWLELSGIKWWDFPTRKDQRCVFRYRGYLIETRARSAIAPSTASLRMRVVIEFYRWLKATGIFAPNGAMWHERNINISSTTAFGFERTISVTTTDLAIPNRSRPGEQLENGLMPVSACVRDRILRFCQEHMSQEIFLLLASGFFTGMRLQTITDLKVQTLINAVPDPASPDLYRLAVGPGSTPSVATKFDVTGHIWIPKDLLDVLLDYAYSTRRLKREIKASAINKDLVFLTRYGNPYARRGSDKSVAVNVEMHKLRKSGRANGIKELSDFRFHQTRCTFATELARLSISAGGSLHAVAIVKEALLHLHESTSLKYIRFVEKTPIKQDMANMFSRAFMGLSPDTRAGHES